LYLWIFSFFFVLVTRGYLPRSILTPLSSNPTPPTPIRRDISLPLRAPQPLPRANLKSNYEQPCLINSLHEENERIYLNQLDCQLSIVEKVESHQYASIDPDDSIPCESNEQVSIIKIFSS